MKEFLAKKVQFNRNGIEYSTLVIADRNTDALHLESTAYLLYLRMNENTKVDSLAIYANILKNFLNALELGTDIKTLGSLTDEQMSAYLTYILYEEKKNSGRQISYVKGRLQHFYEYLFLKGFIEKPCGFSFYLPEKITRKIELSEAKVRSLDPYNLKQKYIPENEFKELLSFVDNKSLFVRERNELILKLGYYSGLRRHETVLHDNLSIKEIEKAFEVADREGKNDAELDIIGKGGKVRKIEIPNNLRRSIERFIKKYSRPMKHNYLICKNNGSELNSQYATKIFKNAVKKLIATATVEVSDMWEQLSQRSFHSLRHSYATNLAMQIFSGIRRLPRDVVRQRLGHSHEDTTLIYIHFAAFYLGDIDVQNEIAEELSRTIRSKSYDSEGQ